jgi:hypothetical protein
MESQTTWILTCEAMKVAADMQQRFEIRVAVLLDDHRQLDQQISNVLNEAGYLFMYSDQALPIVSYLEKASFYDQQVIELSQQVSKQQPIAFIVIRLIEDQSEAKDVAHYLQISQIEGIKPLDRQLGVLQQKTIPDSLYELVFGQKLTSNMSDDKEALFQTIASTTDQETISPLKTYAVVDASKLEVFDGEHFLEELPIKSLVTGKTARFYERLAPYLIELEPGHEFTRRLFTQAENEQQSAWYFYQQNATIIIRSRLGIDEMFSHLRKLTRIYNARTETYLQFRFYEPSWIEDMLLCMTPVELSKFWGSAFDQIIALKPLKESAGVIRVKESIREVKAGKLEMTARYEEALRKANQQRFIQKIITWISQNEQIHPDLNVENLVSIMTKQAELLSELNIKSQAAITKLLSAMYRTNIMVTQWGDEIKQFLLYAEKSQEMKADEIVITLDNHLKLSGNL